MNDLEIVGPNPCPSFEADGIVITIDYVAAQPTGLFFNLPEVHQPRRLPIPIAETFAVHLEVIAEKRVKGNRQDR